MEKTRSVMLEGILSRRKDFIQLVFVAAVLAFGVNLVAGAALDFQAVSRRFFEAIGSSLVLVALAWILAITFETRKHSTKFEAFFLFDPKTERIVRIRGYDFSEELRKAIEATLIENKAFAHIWSTEPLMQTRGWDSTPGPDNGKPSEDPDGDQESGARRFMAITKSESEGQVEEPKSVALLREAIEYIMLVQLSLHLSGYFQGEFVQSPKCYKP